MTVAVSQLGYIGFGATDESAWTDFLTGTIGMEDGGSTPDGTHHYRLDGLRSRIQVHSGGDDDLSYIGWLLNNRFEFQQVQEQLDAGGFAWELGGKELADNRSVTELIVVIDPCGLRNEIAWGPRRAVTPLKPGRPLDKGFVAGDHGVGHVVIKSGDPEAYVRFYETALGLEISDTVVNPGAGPRPGFSINFYHTNGRHHSLAFPMIALPPVGKRLQHFMIELADIDDLGRGQQIAAAKGELLNYLGRHTNDRMISCYLSAPGGVGCEYGWGARAVRRGDPATVFYDGDEWGHDAAGDKSIFNLSGPPADGPGPGAAPGGAPGGQAPAPQAPEPVHA